VEIFYQVHEETGQVPGACGLYHHITTDEYSVLQRWIRPHLHPAPQSAPVREGPWTFDPGPLGTGLDDGELPGLAYFQPQTVS